MENIRRQMEENCPLAEMRSAANNCSVLTLHAFGTYACNGQGCVLTKYPRVSCRIHISDVLCWWFRDVFPLKAHRALYVCDQAVEMSGLITLLCSQVNKCIS